MIPTKKPGPEPNLVINTNEIQENSFIIEQLEIFTENKKNFDDFGILVRKKKNLIKIEKTLRKNRIPYEIRGGLSYFEKGHIKDILSFFHVLHNPHYEFTFKRMANSIPGITEDSMKKIYDKVSLKCLQWIKINFYYFFLY